MEPTASPGFAKPPPSTAARGAKSDGGVVAKRHINDGANAAGGLGRGVEKQQWALLAVITYVDATDKRMPHGRGTKLTTTVCQGAGLPVNA